MKYEIVEGSAGPTLVLRDQLTFSDRDMFDSIIGRVVAGPCTRITVDLGALDYMDSAGLGMLLTLRERADALKAEVRLIRAKGEVRELLALACFDTLFTIGES